MGGCCERILVLCNNSIRVKKALLFMVCGLLLLGNIKSQPVPGASCATAGVITTLDSFSVYNFPSGSGSYSPSCFVFSSGTSSWYQFTVGEPGVLAWQCKPVAASVEFDWALFDITNGTSVGNLDAHTIGCNYNYANQTSSAVGMSTASVTACPTTSATGNAAGEICPSITVERCHTYAIMIDNFSNTPAGFSFNWVGSTFTIGTSADFSITPNKICGDSGTVTILNNSINAVDYKWNFGDGDSSTSANPINHLYTAPGVYTITLNADSNSHWTCQSTTSKTIQVGYSPNYVTQQQIICPGDSFDFNGTIIKNAGNYSYTIPTGTGCDTIVQLTLNFFQISGSNVNATIIPGDSIVLPSGLSVSAAGVYADTFQNIHGCDSVIITTVSIVNDIALLYSNASFSLRPNPATTSVTITTTNEMAGSTITVTDIMGRKVLAALLSTANHQLSTGAFAKGVYLVTITGASGGSATKKLIIEK